MTAPVRTSRVALIDRLAAEWQCLGRTRGAVRALEGIAGRDPQLDLLVNGSPTQPPVCPTPFDLVEHMRRPRGRARREEAARLFRVLLREGGADPFISRMLVQALVPGLVTVARKLRWGQGGEWQDGSEFFGEVLTTTWVVVTEWSGQDRPYAVLDVLSAIRCRLRRQLFRSKQVGARTVSMDPEEFAPPSLRSETGLEELTRLLIDVYGNDVRNDEAQVLYAHHVLGYSITELSSVMGRGRRALSARRDRGGRRLCA